MYSNLQSHSSNCSEQKPGVVLLLNPNLKSSTKPPQPCIFCGTTENVQNFKGKTVCTLCLELIPNLFIKKQLQLV
jgi:hypothetical protein